MQEIIKSVEEGYKREGGAEFRIGDTVRVYSRVQEGDKERLQVFEGIVIRKRGRGTGTTFTVRKISYGIGVERTFPYNSPGIERIEIVAKGRVRRAKLYYLREKVGKSSRVKRKELIVPEEETKESSAEEAGVGAEEKEG